MLAGLCLLILISIGRAVHFTFFTDYGGVDFHSYWYSGLHVRQKTDPYAAYLARKKPQTPIHFYLTGGSEIETDGNRNLARTPANTAPMVLLLSSFSWLPWQLAKTVWFLINLILVGLLPLLVIRYLTPLPRMPWTAVLLTCLIFYALKGTRAALGTGQTTILVLTLMVLALAIWKNSWIAAGLLLGLALSKYSIALPIFLFFLYKRQFKLLALSLVVQLAGVFIISGFSGNNPISIIQSYYQIMIAHVGHPGIHLAELFPHGSTLRIIGPILLTLIVLGLLARYYFRGRSVSIAFVPDKFIDLHVLSIFSLWTLLVAYHRPYDGILIIFFLVMVMYGLGKPNWWQLTPNLRVGLIIYLMVAMAMLIVPYEQIGSIFPGNTIQYLLTVIGKGVILTLVSMLGVTFWLWQRTYTGGKKRPSLW